MRYERALTKPFLGGHPVWWTEWLIIMYSVLVWSHELWRTKSRFFTGEGHATEIVNKQLAKKAFEKNTVSFFLFSNYYFTGNIVLELHRTFWMTKRNGNELVIKSLIFFSWRKKLINDKPSLCLLLYINESCVRHKGAHIDVIWRKKRKYICVTFFAKNTLKSVRKIEKLDVRYTYKQNIQSNC